MKRKIIATILTVTVFISTLTGCAYTDTMNKQIAEMQEEIDKKASEMQEEIDKQASEMQEKIDKKVKQPLSDETNDTQEKKMIVEPGVDENKSNTETKTTTEPEIDSNTNNTEDSISTELFEKVYAPYANREKPFIFDAVMAFAQSVEVDYTIQIIEPTEDDLGTIKIIDDSDNYVYFAFMPIDGIETISILSYHQAATNSEVSLQNYSSDGSKKYDEFDTHIVGEQSVKVNGIDEQRIFLFSNNDMEKAAN